MSQRIEAFDLTAPPRLRIRIPSGSARLTAGPADRIAVRLSSSGRDPKDFLVEQQGDTVVVEPPAGRLGRWASTALVVEVPEGVHVRARLGSADLTARVPLGSLRVDAASGDIKAGGISGDAGFKTASGDIRVEAVGGRLDATVASGDIRVRSVAGDARARSASGDIYLGTVDGEVSVHTASGDVTVGTFRGATFGVKTLSGDVSIGVTPGRRFDVSFQTLSGDLRTDFPVGEESGAPARLEVSSMSGDIIIRAAPLSR